MKGLDIKKPYYIQCFDNSTCIYRIYFYPSKEGIKLCIECFTNTNETELDIIKKVKNITFSIFKDYKIILYDSKL